MRRDCLERFLRHRLQRKPLVSDPGLHHGTRVTHVPWCMSGSLTRGGWKNIPVIPGACATRSFTYLARGPCSLWSRFHVQCHMMPWLYLFCLLLRTIIYLDQIYTIRNFALFGYIVILSGFMPLICPFISGLLYWDWRDHRHLMRSRPFSLTWINLNPSMDNHLH